jgi:hypothetical protein
MRKTLTSFPSGARAACALLLLAASTHAQAAACLYRGTDDTARVIGGGVVTTPFPEARSAPECARLRVASGTVDVVVLSADRAAIASRRVSAGGGALVPPSGADKGAASDESPGLLKQILVVLEGDQRKVTGSSRDAGDDFLRNALPVDKLARPVADLAIVLGPAPDANLHSFELLVDGKPVLRVNGPARSVTLPAAALKVGVHASWRLAYGDGHDEGSFEVVPSERLAELEATLAKESEAGGDAKVARLRIASGLVAQGYSWDARELIRAAVNP